VAAAFGVIVEIAMPSLAGVVKPRHQIAQAKICGMEPQHRRGDQPQPGSQRLAVLWPQLLHITVAHDRRVIQV
jgi:hypothetical protein